MNFKSWTAFRNYNEQQEEKVYCKAELGRMGLKSKPIETGITHKIKYEGWHDFEFFSLSQTMPKKTRTVKNIDLDCSSSNLCESLYIINKSAKKSRDTKEKNYRNQNYGVVARSKLRQIELYNLKDKVIKKMIDDSILVPVGYHEQVFETTRSYRQEDDDTGEVSYESYTETQTNYIILYQSKEFSFHLPVCNKPTDIPFLGVIPKITSEKTRDTTIKFNDAVNLLNKYVS